jgi:hypothetical protein
MTFVPHEHPFVNILQLIVDFNDQWSVRWSENKNKIRMMNFEVYKSIELLRAQGRYICDTPKQI